ncbi:MULTISPECIES: PAS domain-containing sensor histidine kinase [unclassified Chelatococcus]|uniref:sensor histidine kinase n=1 Tax=unclassified Chelatococcus TaxID=2638111 RepID=UPI0020C0455E|nr:MULTISPECIES: PAS domain-containing sensor histidine kinase [unclassified Chelatococcus]
MPTQFLNGGGEMGDAIRSFDWSTTPLGPIQGWPIALKTAVGMMVNSRFPKCIVWGAEYTAIFNDAFLPILGDKGDCLGRSFKDIWSEAWSEIGALVDNAYAGEAIFIEDFPLVVERGGYPEQAWFTFCYSPIRDEQGHIAGIMDTVIETTSRVVAERNARIVNAELAHRMKNTLSVVRAIANQTFRSEASIDDAKHIFGQRLRSLADAHSLLTQASWSGAPISSIVESAIAPHRGPDGAVVIEGPPLQLSSQQALTLALATNELATNAIKYGAWSVPDGRVHVSWTIGRPSSDDLFMFRWIEEDGPLVEIPQRTGFGSRLLERIVAQDFGGEVLLRYEPGGFRYELATKMSNVSETAHH